MRPPLGLHTALAVYLLVLEPPVVAEPVPCDGL